MLCRKCSLQQVSLCPQLNAEAQRKDISACLARQEGTATLSWSKLTVTVTDVKVRGQWGTALLFAVQSAKVAHNSAICQAPQACDTPMHAAQGNERQILKGVDGYIEPNHMLVRST